MPRNRVINRKNVNPLARWSTFATEGVRAEIESLAGAMEVSQGSLVDTALRQLLKQSPDKVAQLMRQYKHLSDDEYAEVTKRLRKKGDGAADEASDEGRARP